MGVSAKPNNTPPNSSSPEQCHCVDSRIVPSRSKMKVLKKIKKKIGLARGSCSSGSSINNLPPLQFHTVHGDNVRLSQDCTIARRVESFCRGVTFTSRPINILEKVCVNLIEISNNWSGVVRFGFTSTNPSTLRYNLPKYACPDLTNKPGYWAKALAERFAERNTVLFYYVTAAGDVHFGINGEEKGIFFSGVDTRTPIWGLFDIYGNCTGLELVSPRTQLNNLRSPFISSASTAAEESGSSLPLALECLSLNSHSDHQDADAVMPAPVSRFHSAAHIVPLPFHKTRGQNVRLSNDRTVASRVDSQFCHGYVFTSRPVRLEEKLIIQIMATEPMYMGALAFGLTSCDPALLSPSQLPEDADALLDRREYWVVNKDIGSNPESDDELVITVSAQGQVLLSKNGGSPVTLMHVDHSLQLWAFFDIYGSTQRIRCIGVEPPLRLSRPVPQPSSRHCCRPASALPSLHHHNSPQPPPPTELLQLQPTMGGGTVLVVNLPPAQSNYVSPMNGRSGGSSVSRGAHQLQQEREPVQGSAILANYNSVESVAIGGHSSSVVPWMESRGTTTTAHGSECTVCYEQGIDSVLYTCGHMCMCYNCAVQQWRGKGGGHCPLCRAVIRDVIRTYKS